MSGLGNYLLYAFSLNRVQRCVLISAAFVCELMRPRNPAYGSIQLVYMVAKKNTPASCGLNERRRLVLSIKHSETVHAFQSAFRSDRKHLAMHAWCTSNIDIVQSFYQPFSKTCGFRLLEFTFARVWWWTSRISESTHVPTKATSNVWTHLAPHLHGEHRLDTLLAKFAPRYTSNSAKG